MKQKPDVPRGKHRLGQEYPMPAIRSVSAEWTGSPLSQTLNPAHSVAITAHRGSSAKAPENTLAAFRQAMVDRCDSIELDVQTCADGTVVVLHDRDLMRMAGDPRCLAHLPLNELKSIDVGRRFSKAFAGERVPTLTEVIDLVRGQVRLNLELKYNRPDKRLMSEVLQILRQEQFLDYCVITSKEVVALREFKAAAPAARTGLIVTGGIGNPADVETDFLSVALKRATADFIRAAHRASKAVHVWTVNKPKDVRRLIENGADNLITDKPDLLRAMLEERTHGSGDT